jgi:gamma-glutamylaminecyclotransferase
MTERHFCFVYGSLMRGMGNHRVIARARFVRTAHTAASFTLRDLGAFPGMVGGGTTRIHGELYEVDDETLASLDRLEGHPRFYRRQGIVLSDGTPVSAYLLPAERYNDYAVVVGGDWRAHLARDRGTGHEV